MLILSIVIAMIGLLPVALFLKNASLFQPACSDARVLESVQPLGISVLIPARNEEASIGPAIESILNAAHTRWELLILDDHSTDATAAIIQSYAQRDPRVRWIPSADLPIGWNGKQHACWQLAQRAQFDRLLFLDADVRVSQDALDRCLAEQSLRNAPLISGFPQQETRTWSERILIPLMHYVLLGYLPIDRMRASTDAGFAAGCGQLFLAEKNAYFACGGHEAIRGSRHDGIQLPRAFRKSGLKTDLFDATDIAKCRMYTNVRQVCNGLLKNATEGIANPKLILPFTILLLGGSVLPWIGLLACLVQGASLASTIVFGVTCGLSLIPRMVACVRFQQSIVGASLHPIGIAWFVALQWIALIRKQLGMTTTWRGRS
jgi:hypothetical protein